MMDRKVFLVGLLSSIVNSYTIADSSVYHLGKRTLPPDNTCGPSGNGYTCDPNLTQGGSCCSSAGACGSTVAYCGTGCQGSYGSCFGSSAPAIKNGCLWTVAGAGAFTQFVNYTFPDTVTSLPSGLMASDYTVEDTPGTPTATYNHTFIPADVSVSGGFLQLKVPGGQTKSPLKCAEVVTTLSDIYYASVRTTAIFSSVAGTVNGNFFYFNDTQEIDIEYLTDSSSLSNPRDGTKPLQLTNQPGGAGAYFNVPSPTDAATTTHEYRIDWIPGKSNFYLDGVLQQTITADVPSVPGSWIWNNWSNGDPGFSVGPPITDNIFKISNIVMYFNRTGSTGTC